MLAQAEQISAQVAENDAMDMQPDIASPKDAESAGMESVPHFQDDNDLIGAELTEAELELLRPQLDAAGIGYHLPSFGFFFSFGY